MQSRVNSLEKLSESLRLQRPDHGNHPAVLGRGDIIAFGNRLAFLEQRGDITLRSRHDNCTYVRRVLIRMRAMGLARPGQPLHGLPDDFALGSEDVPALPDDDEAGHDLPPEVMEVLCANLPQLEEDHNRETRLATEVLIDTGRRPVEICKLAWDCLQRDGDGKPVLIYDNYKSHRYGRRLPIPEATAGLITEQQERVRAQYPDTPQNRLRLLPTTYRCVDGTRSISPAWVSSRHRMWVDSLPGIHVAAKVEIEGQPVTKMLPFDKAKIFPYAYRHTYAQRHADAGVAVDVLQQLMDHEQLATTQQYYNPRELHKAGEKSQVAWSRRETEGVHRLYALAS
ncbi:site-specific integrase [Streptomyces sp. NPDC007076]|uniref:site-specific integrase n=1 Tax=Streptomyces sp. NPDC007076 TaxID=3160975 RepID=UPI0033EF4983